MAIGRDHIASTVYTLVFAYAGVALPLLLLFDISRQPAGAVLTGSLVAEEVIRALVGGIALVLAVPVTTVIGAFVARASGPERAGRFAGLRAKVARCVFCWAPGWARPGSCRPRRGGRCSRPRWR
jgi:hypothetical protein